MKLVITLIFLFIITVGCRADLAPVVKLPIEYGDYVCVLIGSPGKINCLYIDHLCNDTIVLYDEPLFTSQTYTTFPGTILVFMGAHGFRFNAIFEASDRNPSPYVDNREGRICFGPMSQVWSMWTRATLSPDYLVLGMYDHSLSRYNYHPFLITLESNMPTIVTVGNDQYGMWYNPLDVNSYFPAHLYHNITTIDLVFNNNNAIHIEIDDDDIMIQNPLSLFKHSTVYKHESNDTIVFGRVFVHQFVIYFNGITRTQYLVPAFDFFNYGPSSKDIYEHINGLLWVLVLVLWLCATLTVNKKKEVSVWLFTAIEIFVYGMSALVIYVEVEGFKTQRFITFYVDDMHLMWFFLLIAFQSFSIVVGIVTTILHWQSNHGLKMRRVTVETAIIITLWLTQIHGVMEGLVDVFLLIVTALYVNLRLIQTGFLYIHQKMEAFYFSLGFVVFALVFFIFYNVKPILDLYYFGFNDQICSIVLMTVMLCLLPSSYIVAWLSSDRLSKVVLTFSNQPSIQTLMKKAPPRVPLKRLESDQLRIFL